ncbi:hypothetical protein KC865_03780 [Candidatus Kaiserbacteria bacterium]|nr:hypothetical protein [Candidatus Kaiserbacteria bacterium]USN92502.1 MAG: hypothetical protein H6782_01655 [Candidatus Nomurabacteria bacterium]
MEKFEQINEGVPSVEKIKPVGIIAGAPGVGKSTMTGGLSDDITVADIEPTPYTKAEDWPNNYIEEVIERSRDTDLVLITTNPVVVQALRERGLSVTVICPDESLKDEYRQRYIDRGNKLEVVEKIMTNAHKTNKEILSDFEGCNVVFLQSGQYLSDVLDFD